MALDDRTIDLIVRANIDQAGAPLDLLVQKIESFVAAIAQQKQAAEEAGNSEAAWAKVIRDTGVVVKDTQTALGQLLTTRSLIDQLPKLQQTVDTRQSVVDQRADRLNTFNAGISDAPTQKEIDAQARLQKSYDASAAALQRANAALQQRVILLQQIGVLDASLPANQQRLGLDQAQATISSAAETGVAALQEGRQFAQDTAKALADGAASMRLAATAEADAAKSAAQLRAEIEKAAAVEAGEVEKVRTLGAARQQAIDGSAATASRRFDVEEAFRQADAETAAQKVSDKAAADHAQLVENAQKAVSRFIIQDLADRTKAEQAAQDIADKATTAHAQLVENAQKAVSQFVVQESQKQADAQAKVTAAIGASIAAAQRVGDQGIIRNAASAPSGAAATAPVSQATTPEAARGRLATLPGPGAGDLASLQSEVERLQAAMSAGGAGVAQYTEQFNKLDATVKQLKLDLAAAAAEATRQQAEIVSKVSAPPVAAQQSATAQVSSLLQSRGQSAPITDVDDAVDKLSSSMGKGQLTAESYNKVMDQVFAIQRQIVSDASLIDSFQRQAAAVTVATTAFDKANTDLTRLIAAEKAGTTSAQELQQATARLNAAGTNLQAQAAQQAAIDAQLKARKIDTTDLTTATNNLVASSQRLATAQESVSASSGKAFGLSAFQFQNLQFQINDVVTQLSLGQGVLRTFEAQAGQIFQIFDLSISQMKQLALYGVPAAAAIALVVLALERVNQTNSATRGISAILTGAADGATHSVTALVALEREMERLGLSFDDAQKAVKAFLNEGLDDAHIRQFATTARNLAQSTGTDIGAAIEKLSVIPTGDASQLEKLAAEYGVLTPALADYIIKQTQAGQAELARQATIDALSAKFSSARQQAVGPLNQGFIELGNSWHTFLDAIGSNAVLQGVVDFLKEVLEGITAVVAGVAEAAKKLDDLSHNSLVTGAKIVGNALLNSVPVIGVSRQVASLGTPSSSTQLDTANKQITTLQKELDDTKKKVDDLLATRPDLADSSFANLLRKQVDDLTTSLNAATTARDKLLTGGAQATVPGTPGFNSPPGVPAAQFGTLPPANPNVVNKTIPPEMVPIIAQAAALAGISVNDLSALERQEAVGSIATGFKVSPTGARGPLQVEPPTFKDMLDQNRALFEQLAAKINKPLDNSAIDNPNFNALAGALYFKQQTANNGGNTALGAAGYNAGPGALQKVLAGQQALPAETAQYVSNFLARPQSGNNFQPPVTGLTVGGPQTQQAQTDIAIAAIQKQIDEAKLNPELRGTSDAKVSQDNTIATRELTTKIEEFQKQFPGAPVGTGVQNGRIQNPTEAGQRLQQQNDVFRGQQAAQREREQAEVEQEATSLQNSNLNRILTADPTNVSAKQQQAFNAFNSELDQIAKLVTEGVATIHGTPIDQFRQQVLAERDEAVKTAGVLADKAAVDAAVKDRDTQIGLISDQLKTGTITMQAAFDGVAKIVATSGPKIQAAVATSNAALQAGPQTPKTQQELAQNARIDTSGAAATRALDDVAKAKQVDDLIKARSDDLAAVDFKVKNGILTQQQADTQQTQIYSKYHGQLIDNIATLQQQYDLQRTNGTLSVEDYDKLTASLAKATVEANALTESQRKFDQSIEGSVGSEGVKAFETIATAIGAVAAGTGNLGGVIRSVGQAFSQFAAGVLKDLAEIIIKEQLLAAVQAALAASHSGAGFLGSLGAGFSALAGGGGAAAAGGSAIGGSSLALGGLYHGGGTVGIVPTARRTVDLSVFHDAVRMHEGGIAGLKDDEVATILQKGETVRTKAQEDTIQMQLVNGLAGKTQPAAAIKNVLVIDPSDIASAMTAAPGEQVILNTIKRNAGAIRQLVSGR